MLNIVDTGSNIFSLETNLITKKCNKISPLHAAVSICNN